MQPSVFWISPETPVDHGVAAYEGKLSKASGITYSQVVSDPRRCDLLGEATVVGFAAPEFDQVGTLPIGRRFRIPPPQMSGRRCSSSMTAATPLGSVAVNTSPIVLASSRCWSVAGPVLSSSKRTGSCHVAKVTALCDHASCSTASILADLSRYLSALAVRSGA